MSTPIPPNRALFTLRELEAATGGSLARGTRSDASGAEVGVSGISTDTRSLEEGAAFVAIKGTTYDGHEHLAAAQRAGARVAIVERDVEAPPDLAVVRVSSTLEALGEIARAHARRWRALGGPRKVIAITGSAGKTTTRVALSALLERLRPGHIHATQGNLNNLIGTPMVLLGLSPEHRIAVVEIATNAPGEIAVLASIAEPEVGVLTLIDAAHCEGLGSIEGVAEEKGALFRGLPRSGVAIGNADSERVRVELEKAGVKERYTYAIGNEADARVTGRSVESMTSARVTLSLRSPGGASRTLHFSTPLLGEAGALACAAAILTAEIALGERVEGAVAAEAFAAADVGAGAGRLKPRVLADGLVLIDDSYNANPASSCASIRAAAEIAQSAGRRLVLVLGEMRELGPEAARGHDLVGEAAAASGAAAVIAVVGEARRIADRAARAGIKSIFAEKIGDAVEAALATVRPGDVVLVKGSRSVATDRVARALESARAPSSESGASDAHAEEGA